jgi:hypothetical protein
MKLVKSSENRKDNRQLSNGLPVQRQWALWFFEIALVRRDHVA